MLQTFSVSEMMRKRLHNSKGWLAYHNSTDRVIGGGNAEGC